NAGLSFAMARSNLGSQSCAVWPFFVERTHDLAAALAIAAKELDPSLAATAGKLVGIAARLEQVSPHGARTTAGASAPAEQPLLTDAGRSDLAGLLRRARQLEQDLFVTHLGAPVEQRDRLARAARRLRDSVIRPLESAIARTSTTAGASESPSPVADGAPFA